MITKKEEYKLAAKAANLIDELVDTMLLLDNIGEDIFSEWGDVGIMNARHEVKLTLYREARKVLEGWRINVLEDDDQQTCGGRSCEFCRKAF